MVAVVPSAMSVACTHVQSRLHSSTNAPSGMNSTTLAAASTALYDWGTVSPNRSAIHSTGSSCVTATFWSTGVRQNPIIARATTYAPVSSRSRRSRTS
jgi:hypothetical protein